MSGNTGDAGDTGNTGNTGQRPKRQRDDNQEPNPNDPKRPRTKAPSRPFTPGLGPSRPWHGHDSVLGRLRLKDLKKNGYIDWVPANKYPPLKGDFLATGPGAIAGNHPEYAYTPIHPVFRKENWVGLSDGDYQAMAPALRLASCFLSEPYILTLFNGLCEKQLARVYARRHLGAREIASVEHFRSISHDPPDFTSSRNTWKLLYRMRDIVKFTFRARPGVYGTTRRDADKSGLVEGTTQGLIVSLKDEFIQVLRRTISIKTMAKASTFT
ncbi:hypothetical protein BDV97DRAFT_402619 [Delphinella strobiligena]|nr:hypothetical protein BDV97DRAFT_402619 [Delphinella strobiligena]